MKTAISIPDEVFQSAERYAQRRGMTRSALYTEALEQILKAAQIDPITEAYNRLAEEVDTSLEAGLSAIQNYTLERNS